MNLQNLFSYFHLKTAVIKVLFIAVCIEVSFALKSN